MGEIVFPPPEFYPPGVDCEPCTDTLFPAGQWPSRLYVIFTAMIPCSGFPDPPNNKWFQLVQTAVPCNFEGRFTFYGHSYYCRVDLAIAQLWLQVQLIPAADTFFGAANPCSFDFPTNLCQCPPNAARLGSAIISPAPTPLASYLCGQCHFFPWQNTRFETQDVAMDHQLLRLANKQDHSRCYFYIDEEDVPA